jgi:hypothetical protein
MSIVICLNYYSFNAAHIASAEFLHPIYFN